MLKSYGWGGGVVGWVAHVILVSAQGPNPSFFFFWGTFIRLGGLLGQGLGLGLGPGLDNNPLSQAYFSYYLIIYMFTIKQTIHYTYVSFYNK